MISPEASGGPSSGATAISRVHQSAARSVRKGTAFHVTTADRSAGTRKASSMGGTTNTASSGVSVRAHSAISRVSGGATVATRHALSARATAASGSTTARGDRTAFSIRLRTSRGSSEASPAPTPRLISTFTRTVSLNVCARAAARESKA